MVFMNVIDCRCNGDVDSLDRGAVCTDDKQGRWCYVNEGACNDEIEFDGKFYSGLPCKTVGNASKPCACNGESDVRGHGGSCGNGGVFCYVDKDANCTDIKTLKNGKTFSRNVCKGKVNKVKLL